MNRKLKWPTWQHLKCQILLFPIWFIFTNDLDYITLKNSLRDAKNGKYLFNILKRLNPSLILESVLDCWLGLILFWNVGLAGGFDRKMEFIVTGDFTIVIWKWGINQSIWHQFRTNINDNWILNLLTKYIIWLNHFNQIFPENIPDYSVYYQHDYERTCDDLFLVALLVSHLWHQRV